MDMVKRNRFYAVDVVRLPLEDSDDWIEVKKSLSAGDQRRIESAGLKAQMVDGRVFQLIDWASHDFERDIIFLVNWNLVDKDGKEIKLSLDALKALDFDTFDEINKLILKHIVETAQAKKTEREEKTKTQTPPAEGSSEPTS
jgi:hypothetical protein